MRLNTEMQDNAIDSEAAAWAARLDAQPDADFSELEDWLARSPRHKGALLRAQAALSLLGTRPEAANDDDGDDLAESRSRISRWWIGAGGAIAAAAVALALFVTSPNEAVLYATEAGQIQQIALDDGSSMSIDARTKVSVDFTQDQRRIILSEGRALFRASDDPARPFQVAVGDIIITDIGTEFQVFDDTQANEIEVLVTEGEVRIDGPSGAISVTEGQLIRVARSSGANANPMKQLARTDISRVTAWREGRLDLAGESLGEAVDQLNRANKIQIEIVSDTLRGKELFGSFRMDDPRGFARAVSVSLDAQLIETDDRIQIVQ